MELKILGFPCYIFTSLVRTFKERTQEMKDVFFSLESLQENPIGQEIEEQVRNTRYVIERPRAYIFLVLHR